MARLSSDLILSLTDNVSGPARRIDQNLDNLRRQQMRNQEMFNQHRNAMLGTAAAAYVLVRALSTPVEASIKFSTQLEDIRQKADMSADAIERLGRASRDVGLSTAQGAGSITGAIDSMVGSGAVTPEQATEISVPLGKTATAYTADTTELADASSAMVLQLGIAANEMEKAYDIMAVGGKQGSFELKDMAAQFPGVLANAKSLGMEGEKGLASVVAWLQISRRGTADASSAATNLSEFMGKIMSQNAIKNFKGAGVDIVAEMARAIENNVDPIEHAIGIINGLTEGQRAKMGELFADKQVTDFLLQATKGVEDYKKIRDEALAADGTVERDFQARLATPAGAIARFEASIENLNIAIGNSLVPALADFARSVTPMIDGVASFVDANHELVAAVVEITAALIGLRLLASAGGMAGALLGTGGVAAGATVAGAATAAVGVSGAAGVVAGGGLLAAGKSFMGTAFGKMAGVLTLIEMAKYAESIGALDAPDGNKSWHQNAVHQLDPTLERMFYEGYNPLPGMGAKLGSYGDRTLTGAPESEEMASVRAMLADNDSGAIPLHPVELAALRDELAALEAEAATAGNAAGASLQQGLSAQMPAVALEVQALMERLRIIAASGVSIPLRINAPNMPGSFQPPGMPSLGGPRQGNGGPQSITFGDIHVSNPTNADPRTISRMMAGEVSDTLRASHSNGAM